MLSCPKFGSSELLALACQALTFSVDLPLVLETEGVWLIELAPLLRLTELPALRAASRAARGAVDRFAAHQCERSQPTRPEQLLEIDRSTNPLLQFAMRQERSVLAGLFEATNGRNWKRRALWLSISPVAKWQGVATSQGNLVTALNLERILELKGCLPAAIGKLERLESLQIFSTRLEGGLPAELSQLSRLRCLRLNNTRIGGPLPSSMFRGLVNLRELRLNDTLLTGPVPDEVSCLGKLETLDLSASESFGRRMGIAGPLPKSLTQLPMLKKLWLQRTQVSGPLPTDLGKLAELTHLYAFESLLSGPIPASIASCSQLMYLHLRATGVSGLWPIELCFLTRLEEVDLSRTHISGPIPDQIGRLTNLKRLWLSESLVSGPLPSSLGECRSLRFLMLDRTDLGGPLPKSFEKLHHLQELSLQDTKVEGLELALLWGYRSATLDALCRQGCSIAV